MFRIKYSATTDVGLQRDNNEDAYFASAKQGLWVVADGMGGHAAGEVASSIVVETIHREIGLGKPLQDAVQKSHHDILNAANSGIGGLGMGSTVVALLSHNNQYQICWVGDSRGYVFAPTTDADQPFELRQLSTDHSYVQMLYQNGAISHEEMHTHPEKNIITQCLGSVELPEVTVDSIVGDWIPGSQILLCSDGLSDVVKDAEIKEILMRRISLDAKTKALIQAALNAGGKDNITVTLINAPSSSWLWLRNIHKKLMS